MNSPKPLDHHGLRIGVFVVAYNADRMINETLSRIPEVLECHAPAGDIDLLCHVVARDPDDLYRVAEEIRLCPGITRTSTSVYLREVIGYRVRPLLRAGLARPRRAGRPAARG